MAGGGEDRLFEDPRRAAQRTDKDRARIRSRRGPAAQGRRAEHDITVEGPELAAQAIRAGLVDEFLMIVCPVVVGGGKRFFPDGVRLDLDLVWERRFRKGVIVLRYAVRG